MEEILLAPNFQELKDKFNVGDDTIIAYGNKIFVKDKTLSRDLLVHELTHCERQRFDEASARRWWEKYMEDNDFRLQEEIVAYRNQYDFCLKVFKDRNKRAKILWTMANELSSLRYGNVVNHNEAMNLIKNEK
mgnify:CR=1 FL=1